MTKKTGKTAASRAAAAEEALPELEDVRFLAEEAAALAASPRHARSVAFIKALAGSPPQVLLLEGGTVHERLLTGLYWAARMNCETPELSSTGALSPCLGCSICLRTFGGLHRDVLFFSGAKESIKIAQMRELRPIIASTPREARHRVVLLLEAQGMTDDAANAMLKSLEEPSPHTLFVLSAPQREHLLPTLVSRSWVLTLPWPDPRKPASNPAEAALESQWAGYLAVFMATGKGFFAQSGAKGAVDAVMARQVLTAWQRALAAALAGVANSDLAQRFMAMPEARLRMADEVLAEGQNSLEATVNPALVLDWMATRLYLLQPGAKR